MGGFLHRRRFALSVYEVALLEPTPDRPPPEGLSEGEKEKEKRKAMDIWKIKKQFPTYPQLLLLLLLLLSTSPISILALLLPDPPPPPTAPKFENNIKKSSHFRSYLTSALRNGYRVPHGRCETTNIL